MKPVSLILSIAILVPLPWASAANKLPAIPDAPIAKKKDLLFSDDFEKGELAKPWHVVVPTFAVENGALKGTQTREQTIPASEGKPEVIAHAAVHGLDIPTQNSVVECRIKLDGATMVDVEYDDRQYTGSHYGHLCRAQVRLDGVTILDERDGTQSNALLELRKDPVKNKAAIDELIGTHSATFPIKLEAGTWYALAVEVFGDEMRVTIDGKPAAYLKSPGIGHATKSKIEIGVGGKYGWFDDVKVWNPEPVKPDEIEPRTWTSASGSAITGKLLSYRKGVARIATDTNQMLSVRVEQLSAADRAFLEAWAPVAGANWRSVPSLKKGVAGSDVATSQIREGQQVSVTPISVRLATVDATGGMKTRYTVRTQIPPGLAEGCRCVVYTLATKSGAFQTVQTFPLQEGYNEVSIHSLSPESGEQKLVAGDTEIELYFYVVDKRNQCLSNIVLTQPTVQ